MRIDRYRMQAARISVKDLAARGYLIVLKGKPSGTRTVVGELVCESKHGGEKLDPNMCAQDIFTERKPRDGVSIAVDLTSVCTRNLLNRSHLDGVVSHEPPDFSHDIASALFMFRPPKNVSDVVKVNCHDQQVGFVRRELARHGAHQFRRAADNCIYML